TQQYVKLLLIEKATQDGDEMAARKAQEQSIERKIRELRYAIALEKRLSKEKILEGYLNLAYYGAGAYGVEAAAKRYFNTTAANLTISESAMLAGLVQSPSATDPIIYPTAAHNRKEFVLGQMKRQGYITEAEEKAALAETFDKSKVQESKKGCFQSPYPHICEYVRRELKKLPALGDTPEARESLLNRGGLIIKTLIDPKMQDVAEREINKRIKPTDPVMAVTTMIQPKTGLIVAMAQSRPRQGDRKDGGTYLNFAVGKDEGGTVGFFGGSTFKPFIMGAALEKGYPASKTYDAPAKIDLSEARFPTCQGTYMAGRGSDWKVSNGGYGYGVINMVKATASSVNTYYIQLLRDVGICETTKMAQRLGLRSAVGEDFTSPKWQIANFGLGQAEIVPLSLTESFATIANRGKRCRPRILESVTTRDGNPIEIPGTQCKQVIDPEVADAMIHLMTGPLRYGTARGFALPRKYSQAGKTGTGAGSTALAFAGFTPELAGSVMFGIDREDKEFWKNRKQTMEHLRLPSGTYIRGFGADTGRIWRATMLAGLEGKERTRFVPPKNKYLVGERVRVPSVSGMGIDMAKQRLREAGFSTFV
ncbi:MAG: penicillin-binding protein, partial [Propionibacterium sp.]